MSELGRPFTSGRWLVRQGEEGAFVERWTEFTEWALAEAPGAGSFWLLRSDASPQSFLSFGDGRAAGDWSEVRKR